MTFVYLGVLLGGLICMVLLDVRYRLVFGAEGARAAIVLAIGVVFFLAWDLAGIALGIFHRGENAVSTGILLAPELPVAFDSIMIAAGLFDYSEAHIWGVRLGLAPIEDLAYPIAGILLLSGVWN